MSTLLLFFCSLAGLGLSGCYDSGRPSFTAETDEPLYREAERHKRDNRPQEALSAYLKLIARRGDEAPESHLEVGLLYLYHIRDPIAAIYHFRQYLALRPNSPNASQVRQRVDAAIREFARTLPARPVEDQIQRVDLIATLDKLKLENELLKRQIADLQAGRPAPAESPPAASTSAPTNTKPTANSYGIVLDTIPVVRTRPAANKPASPPPTAASTTAPQAASSARQHTVRAGDTLSKISQQYYGNRARWRDIFAANRQSMRNESDLHIGQQLVIP